MLSWNCKNKKLKSNPRVLERLRLSHMPAKYALIRMLKEKQYAKYVALLLPKLHMLLSKLLKKFKKRKMKSKHG